MGDKKNDKKLAPFTTPKITSYIEKISSASDTARTKAIKIISETDGLSTEDKQRIENGLNEIFEQLALELATPIRVAIAKYLPNSTN